MKKYLIDFMAGISVVIIALLTMKFITLDLRIITFLASILLSFCSFAFIRKPKLKLVSITILTVPIVVSFIIGILPELPGMWLSIPVFIFAAFLGNLIQLKKTALFGIIIFGFFSFILVPKIVSKDLSKIIQEVAPLVSFESIHSGKKIELNSFKGKTLIIDFFGTWCVPCIKEMEELKELKKHYKNRPDIEIILVCTEFGKDSPEKATTFAKKRGLSLKTYFDPNNEAHKSFNFTGVPALVVIDKDGYVRLKHEGYNASEDLKGNLVKLINSINNPK